MIGFLTSRFVLRLFAWSAFIAAPGWLTGAAVAFAILFRWPKSTKPSGGRPGVGGRRWFCAEIERGSDDRSLP